LAIALVMGFCAVATAQRGSFANEGNVNRDREYLYKPRNAISATSPTSYPRELLSSLFTRQDFDYNKRLHFGFSLGIGALDYSIISSPNPQYSSSNPDPYTYYVDISTSPSIGLTALMDYRINQQLSLRVQLGPTFGMRTLNFYNVGSDSVATAQSMQLESVLIEMPLLLKYKAFRNSDLRPYMIAGLTPTCDVSAFKTFNEEQSLYVAVKPFDVAITLGIGVDYYFEYFKLSAEVKYAIGLMNVIQSKSLVGFEQYPSAIDKMYSRSFMLSFIFE
jgi:hypothetical protein